MNSPLIVVITGAESTGKSALTKQLGNYYKSPFILEYARDYITSLGFKYQYSDVEHIAQRQITMLKAAVSDNPSLIFMDTWLIITKVWFEEVFNKTPVWLEGAIKEFPVDLFLLCDTDLPWIPEPVRENGGDQREILQQRYIDNIVKYGFPFEKVSGFGEDRFLSAKKVVDNLIAETG